MYIYIYNNAGNVKLRNIFISTTLFWFSENI